MNNNLNILHYSIGVPPFRAGGLPRYTLDIARAELQIGHQVSILYPEGIDYKYPSFHIVKGKIIEGIQLYKLKNPILVPILLGVSCPDKMIRESEKDIAELRAFINTLNPTVVHFHTIMGISLEFVSEIKKMGIKVVLTTHDFYGLCLKGNFIDRIGELCVDRRLDKCALCNYGAPNAIKLRAISEPLLKPIIRKLQKKTSISYGQGVSLQKKEHQYDIDAYRELLDYYEKIIKEMDIVHFNSSQTSEQYLKYVNISNYCIIPITDSFVKDRRSVKYFLPNKKLKLGFIGVLKPYKGFPILKNILKDLNPEEWELNVWGNHVGSDEIAGIHYRGMYNSDTIQTVFDEMDLLVVPSIWYETFSLVTMEALSFGTPVLVSQNVGAKDVVRKYNNAFVYSTTEQLKNMLLLLIKNRDSLKEYNKQIMENPFPYTMQDHAKEIVNKLYR